jgi:hypothetical protein
MVLNTYGVGATGIVLFVASLLADAGIRGAIVAAITQPNPTSISAVVGVIASAVLLYLGKPATVPKS